MGRLLNRFLRGRHRCQPFLNRLTPQVERWIGEHRVEHAFGPRRVAVLEPRKRQGPDPRRLLDVGHDHSERLDGKRATRPVNGPLEAAAKPVRSCRRGLGKRCQTGGDPGRRNGRYLIGLHRKRGLIHRGRLPAWPSRVGKFRRDRHRFGHSLWRLLGGRHRHRCEGQSDRHTDPRYRPRSSTRHSDPRCF